MDPLELKHTIVADLNIGELPPLVQDDIIEKLGQNILEKVAIESLKVIPEDKMDEFDALAGTEEIRGFLMRYVPDYDRFVKEIVANEIADFKKLAQLT